MSSTKNHSDSKSLDDSAEEWLEGSKHPDINKDVPLFFISTEILKIAYKKFVRENGRKPISFIDALRGRSYYRVSIYMARMFEISTEEVSEKINPDGRSMLRVNNSDVVKLNDRIILWYLTKDIAWDHPETFRYLCESGSLGATTRFGYFSKLLNILHEHHVATKGIDPESWEYMWSQGRGISRISDPLHPMDRTRYPAVRRNGVAKNYKNLLSSGVNAMGATLWSNNNMAMARASYADHIELGHFTETEALSWAFYEFEGKDAYLWAAKGFKGARAAQFVKSGVLGPEEALVIEDTTPDLMIDSWLSSSRRP